MRLHKLTFAALTALALGCAAPAYAQEADMNAFSAACTGAQTFLIGEELPPGVDGVKLMEALCGCVVADFKVLPQVDVDLLTTDLLQTSTDATHAAHADYQALQERAGEGLAACFGSAEVVALLPADPAAPAQ